MRGATTLTLGPRPLALLAYLALATRPLTRDHLAALFWGDRDDARARHSLREALSVLRRAIGVDAITRRDELVALAAAPAAPAVDARVLCEASAAGEHARVLALYAGPFLDGVHLAGVAPAFEDWVAAQRAELERRFVSACAAECERLEAAQAWDDAAAVARRWTAAAPLDARGACNLLRALAGPGTRAALRRALDAHAGLAARIDAEFALPADPSVTALAAEYARALAGGVTREEGEGAAARAAAPMTPSVAVLPFIDQQGGADDARESAYLADGLTDALIDALGHLRGLRVAASASSFAFKGTATDAREAARALGVATIVTGRVRRAGPRLRVAVDVIDATSGSAVWTKRFERAHRDVFALQEEMRHAIVAALAPQLLGALPASAAPSRTENFAAYDLYLRGRHFLGRRVREEVRKAIAHFEQALAEDPGYAAAWAGIADAYTLLGYNGLLRPREAIPRAADAVRRALALDGTLAEAHASLGAIHLAYDWDWDGAARELRTAMALKPEYATARQWYAIYLLATGAVDEAIAEIGRARALDPLSAAINAGLAPMLLLAGRYEVAIAQLRRTLELEPDFAPAYGFLGWAYYLTGRRAEAAAAAERGAVLAGANPLSMAYVKALAGDEPVARALLAAVEQAAASTYVQPVAVARAYAIIGDEPATLAWLGRALDERDPWSIYLAVDPTFAPLRGEPAFVRLLARLALPGPS
ncbi:transcriptional activator domain-containing protein (plasmid) [Gemmatirosa kalamazoonensis]|uniref:Transcriptional activator domain-containing protein n=2 Tax=Gemmatirosa kalamazoonensis TaxID=861299 RepID=W0RQI8_9BACT|nr:transcriptional activator domain-containing protein [Gemmatirosa kalamazoonensis]